MKINHLVTSLLCTSLLIACGEEIPPPAASTASNSTASAPSAHTVYRVAVEIDLPFTVQGPNGTISGFDYDLLKAIGAKQGFDVRFEPYSRTGMFDALAEKKADITASGIYLNDERKTRFDATQAYMDSGTVLLVHPNTQINGLSGMIGKRVSVKSKTVAEGLAKNVLGEGNFKTHPTLWMAYKDLMTKRADAVLGDYASLNHYAKQYPDKKLVLLDNLNLQREQYVFLVQKGNKALLEKLNRGITEAKEDGTYQRLYRKWFEGAKH